MLLLTYVAYREELTIELPFGQATRRRSPTMDPAMLVPAHLFAMGATISPMNSVEAGVVGGKT